MFKVGLLVRCMTVSFVVLVLVGCRGAASDPNTVAVIIESSPTNLDLRQGSDAQSERVGGVIYDALVKKDSHYALQPWLATSWEQPDPQTWIFHLRDGVRFSDGKPLTAEDVAFSLRSMYDGTLVTVKSSSFSNIASVEVRDPLTVVVHMKKADESLLFNVSDGLFGVVERGAKRDEGLHPVGSGPFKFVSQVQDKDVVLERNPTYWGPAPKIQHVRFDVVPETITAALMIKKGVADIESNVLTPDMANSLKGSPGLKTVTGPSSIIVYMNFNVRDPLLRDKRVRQAIASAIDRPAMVKALWRSQAELAYSLLPAGHWALAPADGVAKYSFDPARARRLLDEAGYPIKADGWRFQLTIKTSTDETMRLQAIALQQQMREIGIDMRVRSTEFATFYSDITKGAFQMYFLRWIGSNEDPDIFRYAYATGSFPPKGSNRGYYSNPQVDSLLTEATTETDQNARRERYVAVQKILAEDVPSVPLWYMNNVVIHNDRLANVHTSPSGNVDFLRDAELR